jgi:branched-chain amino acid transport system permease protein
VSLEALRDLYLTYQSVAAFVGINALLALSVYATLSCGQLSLANAGFMAIGAYTGALLALHTSWPFPAILLASALLPAVVAVPLGLPVLRLSGVFLAIATIGFGEVVRLWFVNWTFTNGAQGLVAIPQRAGLGTIYLCLALALFVFWRLKGSRVGFALESIREDEAAARTMGIDSARYKLAMLVLGAALAGIAGGLESLYTFIAVPSSFGFGRVVDMLVYAVVGGASSFFGPVVGAGFLTALPELLRELGPAVGLPAGPLRLFVNGLVLLLVILFLPNGMISLPRRVREWSRSRTSTRAARAR